MDVVVRNIYRESEESIHGATEHELVENLSERFPWIEPVSSLDEAIRKLNRAQALEVSLSIAKSEGKEKPNLDADDDTWDALLTHARKMVSADPTSSPVFEAARFLSGKSRVPVHVARRSLILHDADVERAALHAYGLECNKATREALRGVASTRSLSKSDDVRLAPQVVLPGSPDALGTSASLERAFQAGAARSVDLQGKHSKDAQVARDPTSGRAFLIKFDSGGSSPASGVREEPAGQPRREAAFWHVANHTGMGGFYPRADLVIIGSDEAVAMALLPPEFKNLEDVREEDGLNHILKVLEPYRKNGLIYRWAALDWICANPDRHAGNLMIYGDSIALIDQGSAFAGPSFDPGHDPNSFIPFYLRAWQYKDFNDSTPEERAAHMPHLDGKMEATLKSWVDSIDAGAVSRILHTYGIIQKPSLDRLALLKQAPSKHEFLRDAFAGVNPHA